MEERERLERKNEFKEMLTTTKATADSTEKLAKATRALFRVTLLIATIALIGIFLKSCTPDVKAQSQTIDSELKVSIPFGKVHVKFAEKNDFGVMDHDVKLESGMTVHNPMRVVHNGEGSEFLFTLTRQPEMSDEQFMKDKEAVENDLETLKKLLERKVSI